MGAGNQHRVATRRRALALAALILVGSACSSGGDDDESSDTDETNDRPTATTAEVTTTQPPGSDPAAVQTHIEALLARYDEVVNQMIADPSIAADRDSPQVEEYLSLFAPDAEFPEEQLDGLAGGADADRTIKATFADQPISAQRLIGPVETVSDDEVRFSKCTSFRYTELDSVGDVRDQSHIDLHGDGTARRVDGVWRLELLQTETETPGCPSESEAA